MTTESEFPTFLDDLLGLSLSEADLDILQWAIEDRIDEDRKELELYYNERPEWRSRYQEKWSRELRSMLDRFLEEEHYEKCARIQEIRHRLRV
jgi:hypothetical protein